MQVLELPALLQQLPSLPAFSSPQLQPGSAAPSHAWPPRILIQCEFLPPLHPQPPAPPSPGVCSRTSRRWRQREHGLRGCGDAVHMTNPLKDSKRFFSHLFFCVCVCEQLQSPHSWLPADRQNVGWALSPERRVLRAQRCSQLHSAQKPAAYVRVQPA